jgi:diaminopimelate decarboxylase
VRYLKQTGRKKFAIVDAGMNDLIRPALYEAYHEIVPVREPGGTCSLPSQNVRDDTEVVPSETQKIDIVGPVCESGDFLALEREMPPLREGDLLAVMSAGAYGFVMASNYNSRPLPAEALVQGDTFRLIRKRQSWGDLIKEEC